MIYRADVHAGGSPYEIGVAVGRACADRVRAAVAAICRFDMPPEVVEERLGSVVKTIGARFPEALEEAAGIADGAAILAKDILLLSFAPEIDGRLPGYCSLMAVDGPEGPLLGKNLDTPAELGAVQVVQLLCPRGRIPFVHITTAGAMWTDGGVNEEGLALVNASLASSRQDPAGVPDGYLAREILARCRSVADAKEFLGRHSARSAGENLLLADAGGNVAVAEIIPGRHSVADVRTPAVACNRALDARIAVLQPADDPIRENSDRRQSALGAIAGGRAAWTAEAVFAALSHQDVRLAGADGLWTVASMAISPAQRRFDTQAFGPGTANPSHSDLAPLTAPNTMEVTDHAS